MSATDTIQCTICFEDTRTTGPLRAISCRSCKAVTCGKCTETYLLGLAGDPHCPSPECNAVWTRSFLVENMTKTFMTDRWKKKREVVLFEREQALFPLTQPLIENRRKAKELVKEAAVIYAEAAEIQRKYQEKMSQAYTLQRQIERLENSRLANGGAEAAAKQASTFTRKCMKEGCAGFLSSQYKCGVCEGCFCPRCFDRIDRVRDNLHTCNPDSVATAEMIKRDSKPCPKCGISICKTEGCDQMFCTSCLTPFSWQTGQIVNHGRIHNPHFFEYLQRNGGTLPRPAGDVPCGGLPDWYTLSRDIPYGSPQYDPLRNFFRTVAELIDQNQQLPDAFTIHDNEIERLDFMMNDITKEDFQRIIQRKEKQRDFKREFGQVNQLLVQIGSELFQRMTGRNGPKLTAANAVVEVGGLRDYVNELYLNISKGWTLTVPKLGASNRLERQKYKAPGRAKKTVAVAEAEEEDDAVSVLSDTEVA
jgi:hypothetical protein